MKILSLKFMNLNSLYGEWSIDFTRPEYTDNGLFAIVGPTGAGKSTILDAICLALYGETPRLGKITAGSNEIMSRQTGECYAEVVFATADGRYRCQWRQHRARKRPDGRLGEASHEIADADTGRLLENRKRDVAAVIEEKTGMNFERFTQSILLAQGRFAAFLQAGPDERSPILEQITGTAIYSDLSIAVHERQRAERQTYTQLQAQIQSIPLLPEPEAAQLAAELDEQKQKDQVLAQKQEENQANLTWRAELLRLEQELAGLSADEQKLAMENAALAPRRQQLAAAKRAQALESDFSSLTVLRSEQQKDQASLTDLSYMLPALEEAARAAQVGLAAAKADLQAARSDLDQIQPTLQATRQMDWAIAQKTAAIDRLVEQEAQLDRQLAESSHDVEQNQESLARLQAEQAAWTAKWAETAADEGLTTNIAGIAAQFRQIRETQADIRAQELQLSQEREQEKAGAQTCADLARTAQEAGSEAEVATAALAGIRRRLSDLLGERSLAEYRTEWAALQREARLCQKIMDLEAERQKLSDGQPCPLCGATDHPFARGNLPELDEIEQKSAALTRLIEQAEQLNQQILEQTERITGKQQACQEAERQLQMAEADLRRSKALSGQRAQELENKCGRLKSQLVCALNQIAPYGFAELPPERLDEVLEELRTRSQARQDLAQSCQERAIQIEQTSHRLDLYRQRLEDLAANSQTVIRDREVASQQLLTLISQRQELFGARDPETVEAACKRRLEEQDGRAMEAGEQAASTIRQLDQKRSGQSLLDSRIKERQIRLDGQEAAWLSRLAQADFSAEEDFLAARLTPADLSSLQKQIEEIDRSTADLRIRTADRQRQHEQLLAENRTAESLAALQERRQFLENERKTVQQRIGEYQSRWEANCAAQEKVQTLGEQFGRQQTECRKWDRLELLIGSADGKKYRNFAQGLTFECMVAKANQQLMQMTDRYLLVRDQTEPLLLNVIDNYQAGEIRTTRNLSGGESFLVSLALALGLSRLASRNVQVDTLFLDEGFGTLDEETLETALETLASLQMENKLIGVISHVPALKERISTQVRVLNRAGGKSTLAGPGVERVNHPA